MLLKLFLIGAGGFIGSVLRYSLGGFVHKYFLGLLPYGTLAVNVLGCLIIGFLGELTESRNLFSPELRMFVFIGLLGGFTTFSTFGYETMKLMQSGEALYSFSNIFFQVVLGLAAVWLGIILAKLI